MAGFDENGLEIKTIEDIVTDIESDQRALIDPALDVTPDQPLGQMNGIKGKRTAETWELAQYVWGSLNPATAEGIALDNANNLNGVPRLDKKRSTIILFCGLDAGTVLPAGSTAAVTGESSNTWLSTNAFTAGPAGLYQIGFESSQDGVVDANSTSITTIVTPVTGWNSVSNGSNVPLLGRDRETDDQYRLRRDQVAAESGSETTDSIRAKLLAVRNVSQAVVNENNTDGTVAGLPPHSIQAILFDDANQALDADIAQVIWDNKPGGIQTFGNTQATAIDKNGALQIVFFTRGAQQRVQMQMVVQVLEGWQDAQLAAMRTAILNAFRTNQRLGGDVLSLKYKSIAIAQPNAYNVTSYDVGIYPSFSGDVDLPIDPTAIAILSDVDLNVSVVNIGRPL